MAVTSLARRTTAGAGPGPRRSPGASRRGGSALAALARAPFSRRARRELLFCLAGIPLGLVVIAVPLGLTALRLLLLLVPHPRSQAAPLPAAPGLAALVALAALITLAPRAGRALGRAHRRTAALVSDGPLPGPAPARPARGPLRWAVAALRDGPGWRAVAYQVLKLPVALLGCYAVILWWGAGLANLTYPLWWPWFRNHPPGVRLSPAEALTPFGFLRVATYPGTFAVCAAGAAMVAAAPWVTRGVASADLWLMRELLGPGRLAQRVADLERSRAQAVDDSAALLRRLERDLHDGAQIRLATLAMNLGMALDALDTADLAAGDLAAGRAPAGPPGTARPATAGPAASRPGTSEPGTSEPATAGPTTRRPGTGEPGTGEPGTGEPGTGGRGPDLEAVRELVAAAHQGARDALAELRDLVRGIHPPALDTGLADALATLAAGSPVPVRLRADVPVRPTPAIETIAYFCAAELLANAVKHSGATAITVRLSGRADLLELEIADDGRGGADPAGSGLAGLAQRVATVDGRLTVTSPPGGPTLVRAELPLRA